MSDSWSTYADWNPWHGCTKISAGCKYCYVYRQDEMYGCEIGSNIARKTAAFDLPVKRKRDKTYKIPSGKVVFTCFTSDFFLKDADGWRPDCWRMIRERSDCMFYFFTKRIDRFSDCNHPTSVRKNYDYNLNTFLCSIRLYSNFKASILGHGITAPDSKVVFDSVLKYLLKGRLMTVFFSCCE